MMISLALLFRVPPAELQDLDERTLATIFDILEEANQE